MPTTVHYLDRGESYTSVPGQPTSGSIAPMRPDW